MQAGVGRAGTGPSEMTVEPPGTLIARGAFISLPSEAGGVPRLPSRPWTLRSSRPAGQGQHHRGAGSRPTGVLVSGAQAPVAGVGPQARPQRLTTRGRSLQGHGSACKFRNVQCWPGIASGALPANLTRRARPRGWAFQRLSPGLVPTASEKSVTDQTVPPQRENRGFAFSRVKNKNEAWPRSLFSVPRCGDGGDAPGLQGPGGVRGRRR